MKLYSGPLSMFGAKTEIAIHEKQLDCDIEHVPFSLRTRYEPKHPDVLRINPKAQVPVLIDGDVEIFDSTQIFEYLEHAHPEPSLWPSTPLARAKARCWELQSDEVFFPYVIKLMSLRENRENSNTNEARVGVTQFYDKIEQRLQQQSCIVGDLFTYADIAFIMAHYFAVMLGADISDRHSHIDAWRSRIIQRPSVSRVLRPMSDYLDSQKINPPSFIAY